jgi:hypothetical protein
VKQHIGSTMTRSLDTTARFDDSFLSHMVRDNLRKLGKHKKDGEDGYSDKRKFETVGA